MKKINPQWVEAIQSLTNPCPYFQLQSMQFTEMGFGSSRIELELQKKHLQPFGIVHGGVFSSLVDAAGFWAVYSRAEADVGMTTVELKLNYLAPAAEGGRLIGLGKCIKLGRSIGLAESRIEDGEGRLLAHGTVTLMVVRELSMPGQGQMPPKFL